jgi:branched-chain amino acid transport system ATP-binding protein
MEIVGPGAAMRMAAADPLLQAKGITRFFGGVRALDGVDLTVRRGSVHGLIGPNGAGKTTLLNLIAGVFAPSAGSLQFGTEDITRHSAPRRARSGIRRTFQNLKLFLELTALENVAIGLHADTRCGFLDAVLRLQRQRREENAILERAMQALSFVGLTDEAHARASTLAYGHRRLLEIARAIVASPHLLLLDEPAAGLNATESAYVTGLITQLRDGGTTILLVEHHMDVVMSACDEITVLNYGRKLAHGAPAEVQNNTAVIEAYLGRSMDDLRACA